MRHRRGRKSVFESGLWLVGCLAACGVVWGWLLHGLGVLPSLLPF